MADGVTCAPVPFRILGCPRSHPAALLCAEPGQEAPCPGAPRAAHSALSAAAQEVAEIRHHVTPNLGRIHPSHPPQSRPTTSWVAPVGDTCVPPRWGPASCGAPLPPDTPQRLQSPRPCSCEPFVLGGCRPPRAGLHTRKGRARFQPHF